MLFKRCYLQFNFYKILILIKSQLYNHKLDHKFLDPLSLQYIKTETIVY